MESSGLILGRFIDQVDLTGNAVSDTISESQKAKNLLIH